MDNDKPPHEIKQEIIKNVSFHDLIAFKEDLLNIMKDMKSEFGTKITSEFKKYNSLMDKFQNKFKFVESSFLSKLNYIEEKEDILSKIKETKEEFERHLMRQNIIINNCTNDLRNSCFKYDKIIMDNLYVPSLIGQACQFPNLKEYILSNKDAIDNCLIYNKQKDMDLKLFKAKIDESIIKFNFQMKMTLDNNTQFIKIKIEDFEKKYYDNLKEVQNAVENISLNINQNKIKINEYEIKNDEIMELFRKIKKKSEKNEKNITNLYNSVNSMKNDISNIKRNLIEVLSLLSTKNNNKDIIKEFNDIINNINNHINTENNNYIYEHSLENKSKESKESKKTKNNLLTKKLSDINLIDEICNSNEKSNNLNNSYKRLLRRFHSNRSKNFNMFQNNLFNQQNNIFFSENLSQEKNEDYFESKNNMVRMNSIALSNKKIELGKTNISSNESQIINNNSSLDMNLQVKENINKDNNILMPNNKQNSIDSIKFLSQQKLELSDKLNIKNNNYLKRKLEISLRDEKKDNNNNTKKIDNNSFMQLKNKENNENNNNKNIVNLFNKSNKKYTNKQLKEQNNIKKIIRENNSENNINSIILDNKKSINDDIKNNEINLNSKKNIFFQTINKTSKKKSAHRDSKFKILQKNSNDFNSSPMIIKNINEIIKHNTFSAKKDDLLNKKLSLLSPKLNTENINNNIRYNNELTAEEKDEKNHLNRNKNQKLLKISGSADFGLKNKFSKNYLSYNNIFEKENDKEIYLDKDTISKLKCVKDDKIIDKPLLLNKKDYFSFDLKKSNVENKIIELEYFTKRKFDELVREIKYFIPIHFNSHIRNYETKKIK